MKNSFVFYNNWSAMIEGLDTLLAGKLIQVICHYARTGEVADIDPTAKAIFLSIKPIMDEDNEKYDAKVKQLSEARQKVGHTDTDKKLTVTGKKNTVTVPKNTVTVSKKPVTDKKNTVTGGVNVNVNVNDNVSSNEDIYIVDQVDPVSEIVDYLNEKTQSNFKAKTDNTKKAIKARLKEGYTVEDFKKVIDDKVKDWADDSEMRGYLRPSTLFRPSNFEAYLNEANRPRPTPKPEQKSNNAFQNFEQNSYDFDELEKRLTLNI